MEEDKTDATTEVQAGADRNSAETDRGGGGVLVQIGLSER